MSNKKLTISIIILLITMFLSCFLDVYAAVPEGFDFTKAANASYVEGELLVRFAPKSEGIQRTITERNKILSSVGGSTLEHNFKIVPSLSLVKLPRDINVTEVLVIYNNTEGILYAQPNYIVRALSTFPDDTRFDELWGMYNTGQSGGTTGADIHAPEAWDIITDSNIIVAVIDTGIDYSKSFRSRTRAVLGFTPQALDHAINSVMSTRLLKVSQL